MNTVKALHRKSIQLLDEAWMADKQGNKSEAADLRLEAYQAEKEAAELTLTLPNSEPTRSIIVRSAATIALSCGMDEEAEHLIYRLLALNPPDSIAEELRDVLEQIWFMRHLSLRGIELSNDELQISLAGKGIGFGFAPTSEVVQRLDATNTLMFRTAERRLRKEYRETGPPTNYVRNIAQQYISVPRAASFAVTIRIGKGEQRGLAGISSGEVVIDDMLDCLELFNAGDTQVLAERISDTSYLKNFLALAQGLVPDGEVIKTVGFTTIRNGELRRVALRRTWAESKDMIFVEAGFPKLRIDETATVDITGWLRFADSLHEKGKIKIQNESRTTTVSVPEGMMNDIVQPHWNQWVTVRVIRKGKSLVLAAVRRDEYPA